MEIRFCGEISAEIRIFSDKMVSFVKNWVFKVGNESYWSRLEFFVVKNRRFRVKLGILVENGHFCDKMVFLCGKLEFLMKNGDFVTNSGFLCAKL